MEFITLRGVHVNLQLVRSFYWANGVLSVHFAGEDKNRNFVDNDKELYARLCNATGQAPAE